MKKTLLVTLLACCGQWSAAAISADFIAIRLEAENYSSKTGGWTLTSPSDVPAIQPDPDPPHNDTASGQANMELLPDSRVTDHDEIIAGENFWGNPGPGPQLNYKVDIPEAGRYLVYVKAYSTGTEDNGIHVGLNGTKPESGARIQLCSKHGWFWTSGQRTAANHCGVTKTIYLDITTPGVNEITLYAREDGFEVDQILLLQETHDGSLNCFPQYNDILRCADAVTNALVSTTEIPISPVSDGNVVTPQPPSPKVDLDISIAASASSYRVGDNISYQLDLANNDADNSATNTAVTILLPSGLSFVSSSDCTGNGNSLTCELGELSPRESRSFRVDASIDAIGNHRVDASATSDQDEASNANNMDSSSISVTTHKPDFDAAIEIARATNSIAVGDKPRYLINVSNVGLQSLAGTAVTLPEVEGISWTDLPSNCSGETIVSCTVNSLLPEETHSFAVSVSIANAGQKTITAQLSETDGDNTNNTARRNVIAIDPELQATQNQMLVLEAENFSSNTPGDSDDAPAWFRIDEQWTPLESGLDPDNASAADASGGAYMEILPDIRIDNNSPLVANVTNYSTGGSGPTLSYHAAIYEPGSYQVFARIRSNNQQDATLFVGLDNDWSSNPSALTLCNPDGSWQWSSSATSNNICSAEENIVLQFPKPGVYTIMVSQATDGLELDKLLLMKAPVAAPSGNGPAEFTLADSIADISLKTSASTKKPEVNQSSRLNIELSNKSSTVDTIGLEVVFSGVNPANVEHLNGFDSCRERAGDYVCDVDQLEANQTLSAALEITSASADELSIETSVNSGFKDNNMANNSDALSLSFREPGTGTMSPLLFLLFGYASYRRGTRHLKVR
ncbi:hypothetical protein AB833_06810 [Chromatiales bacterium (ex Bugula neritina AB1)]|nr:hypothetical protein AB833_06810 [Chromatiales bacterium (ex Bugula neritina AB1)]